MELEPIGAEELACRPFDLLKNRWALLACGDLAAKRFNCMTVSWGSLGVIWGKPFAMTVVRPTRYTYQFMQQYDTFTLSIFPEKCKPVLDVLGSKSGREMDKVNGSGLTPTASAVVPSPSFAEAELVLECRKMYFDDLHPQRFLSTFIEQMYNNDYHRMYFGEIVLARGTAAWKA